MLHRDLLTEDAIAQKSIQTSEGIRTGLFALWTPPVKVTKAPRKGKNIGCELGERSLWKFLLLEFAHKAKLNYSLI